MQIKMLLYIFLISTSIIGQEIGIVKKDTHSIKLLKSNNIFSCVYSDLNSKIMNDEKSFNFPNKETVFSIIMNGFDKKNNHQIVILTDNDTIVKFEYTKIRGIILLKINQNNLKNNTVGISAFFNKEQIIELFSGETS